MNRDVREALLMLGLFLVVFCAVSLACAVAFILYGEV